VCSVLLRLDKRTSRNVTSRTVRAILQKTDGVFNKRHSASMSQRQYVIRVHATCTHNPHTHRYTHHHESEPLTVAECSGVRATQLRRFSHDTVFKNAVFGLLQQLDAYCWPQATDWLHALETNNVQQRNMRRGGRLVKSNSTTVP
jgi:hypothetical protein